MLSVAVIGSGISGLSAAWLLSSRHRVTLFEADGRLGGHTHTVDVAGTPVDTGFIVYNQATYPNLTALFDHLGVATRETEMGFAVSIDGGRIEYGANERGGLLARRRNAVSPRFWSMIADLVRFYRNAPRDCATLGAMTLGEYLDRGRYGAAFRDDHLYPMAAAIWSTPAADIGRYPAASFIRFCDNHRLLSLKGRPVWRTVIGGSSTYIDAMTRPFADNIVAGDGVEAVTRRPDGVELRLASGEVRRFDEVVIATHADQALDMLADADGRERALLGAFSYARNDAVLHSDPALMPKRRKAWAAWNYLAAGTDEGRRLSVSYWMNDLQGLPHDTPLFVTLNPLAEPDPALVHKRVTYEHPLFDAAALEAQQQLWSIQGTRRTWFCGAYFGAGFHEDGLQSGLAVAERLGGVRRPWDVADESGRIALGPMPIRAEAA